MASLSALKNKTKAAPSKKAVAPTKKAIAKKAVVKKAPVKKAAPVKIAVKKELTAADVRLIITAKEALHRQKEVSEELAMRGVTSLNRIPKKVDKPLVDEARAYLSHQKSDSCSEHFPQWPTRAIRSGKAAIRRGFIDEG